MRQVGREWSLLGGTELLEDKVEGRALERALTCPQEGTTSSLTRKLDFRAVRKHPTAK